MRNNFEFDIDGKIRGFRFGTYAIAVAQKQNGAKSIGDLFTKLQVEGGDFITLLDLFYGAAMQYADHKKQKPDFSVSDVSDWLDEIGLEKTMELVRQMLYEYTPKNSSPQETLGEPKNLQ